MLRAISVQSFGGPGVLVERDVAEPVPGPGEVLVELGAAGVNPVDTYIRSGAYGSLPGLPFVPGMDGAGVVAAVGDAVEHDANGRAVSVGERVWVWSPAGGAYAERCVVPADRVFPLPDGVSFEEGACVGVPYLTAWHALVHVGGAGDAGDGEPTTVFVHGATGGVGTAAVQIAVMLGLPVVGSAGSDAGAELIERLGGAAVRHDRPGYEAEVTRLTGGGPGVIIEMLANVNLRRDLELIAPGGRVVIVGSRGEIAIDPRAMMGKGSRVEGMSLLTVSEQSLAACARGVVTGLDRGGLRPVVREVLPLRDAAIAHELVMTSPALGSIVLSV